MNYTLYTYYLIQSNWCRVKELLDENETPDGKPIEPILSEAIVASAIDANEGGNRKITRNQKRRHNEINHVPKVTHFFVFLYFSRWIIKDELSFNSRSQKWIPKQLL